MAVSLVTGFAGKAHITSLDTARFNAGVVGKGDYVFAGVGDNKLKATMASSNKVHIASGNGMMQGRHFVVDAAGVDLTVQTGTQGQKRNDLVVARYTKNSSTGVEAVDLAVIKGTPTTGTPADPAYTKGDILNGTALTADMPLWRIPLNGITVGAPVQMFTEVDSAKDAWDSVSQEVSDGVTAACSGPVVTVTAALSTVARRIAPWDAEVIATLPEGYRPRCAVGAACYAESSTGTGPCSLVIEPSGAVSVQSRGVDLTAGTFLLSFCASYGHQ